MSKLQHCHSLGHPSMLSPLFRKTHSNLNTIVSTLEHLYIPFSIAPQCVTTPHQCTSSHHSEGACYPKASICYGFQGAFQPSHQHLICLRECNVVYNVTDRKGNFVSFSFSFLPIALDTAILTSRFWNCVLSSWMSGPSSTHLPVKTSYLNLL